MKKNNYLMRQFWLSVVWYLLLLFFCYDFLNSGCLLSLAAIISIKSYSNAEDEKDIILKENQNKSGLYMWRNLINNKRYIGSSENMHRRFREYFNINHLLKNKSMYICNSLIKHGYSNFSLTILEYCLPDKCLEREGYYWKLFKPEYNIAQDPTAPMSGRTHSDESKQIMSELKKIKNSGSFKKGENHPNYGQPKIEGSGKPSQAIEVTDIQNNNTTTYNSMREAARVLNLPNFNIIRNYIKNNQVKPYKGKYTFKNI